MVVPPKSAHMHELMAHELAKHGRTAEAIAEFAKVRELAKEALPEPLIKVPGRRSEPAP